MSAFWGASACLRLSHRKVVVLKSGVHESLLSIFDVEDPDAPLLLAEDLVDAGVGRFKAIRSYLFLFSDSLNVWDVSDPRQLVPLVVPSVALTDGRSGDLMQNTLFVTTDTGVARLTLCGLEPAGELPDAALWGGHPSDLLTLGDGHLLLAGRHVGAHLFRTDDRLTLRHLTALDDHDLKDTRTIHRLDHGLALLLGPERIVPVDVEDPSRPRPKEPIVLPKVTFADACAALDDRLLFCGQDDEGRLALLSVGAGGRVLHSQVLDEAATPRALSRAGDLLLVSCSDRCLTYRETSR